MWRHRNLHNTLVTTFVIISSTLLPSTCYGFSLSTVGNVGVTTMRMEKHISQLERRKVSSSVILLSTTRDEVEDEIVVTTGIPTEIEGSGADEEGTEMVDFDGLPGSQMIDKFLTTPLVELTIVGLILLSSLLIAIDTLPDLPRAARTFDIQMLDTIGYIFVVEFFARWYASGQLKFKFLLKPLSIIDIIVVVLPLVIAKVAMPLFSLGVLYNNNQSISLQLVGLIPPWLNSSSGLINLLLLRILRVQRYLVDLETFAVFEEALGIQKEFVRPYQLAVARVVLSIYTLLSISTGLIYTAEEGVNPQIPDYFTALYFGLTTLTTVGFGDIVPVTFQGRLVVSLSILAGVAIIPVQAASLVEALIDYDKEKQDKKKEQQAVRDVVEGNSDSSNSSSSNSTIVATAIARDNTVSSESISMMKEIETADVITVASVSDGTVVGEKNMYPWDMIRICSCGEATERSDARFCQMCGVELTTMVRRSSRSE